MRASEAQRVIESLRKGLPPDGYVPEFTVGRKTEIADLSRRLESEEGGALLLQANYGSGKTHLLRFIRETALSDGYTVSLVSLDARGGVRFNRMDQILGAICRHIEVPGREETGIRALFSTVRDAIESSTTGKSKLLDSEVWHSTRF